MASRLNSITPSSVDVPFRGNTSTGALALPSLRTWLYVSASLDTSGHIARIAPQAFPEGANTFNPAPPPWLSLFESMCVLKTSCEPAEKWRRL